MGFSDESGAIRAALGFVGPGPALEFADAEGAVRAHLSDTADATKLVSQDEQGIPRAALGISADGGILGLFDESGTLRTSVGHTPESSAFEIYDAQGTLRADLGFSQGSPGFSLNDSSQTPRVAAGFVRSTQEPSWWLQPMSRTQATVLGLPAIAATVLEWTTGSGFLAFAGVLIAGAGSGVIYLVLDYLRSERSVRVRRFRLEEDDSRRKWRRYRWPRGARAWR